ncbi:filamentous hemagglutinin N-terminal domain-containing protein [Nostoc sp. UHCC 0252]|uniref:two-partner secretion domain-containing protein n=1 Tax=Nostoc sp. UHCC 0252 TaxID=3110241 RepID=UPI002B1EB94E|nr:filamentous hemagglutinin N-terminal domain-containing protein [Nostoc sp. UHCC 0252]MEA5603987.1 filamentous hemagglutinin N-terminal domain-containing protein [Nostoc sp. UHCC 0252]
MKQRLYLYMLWSACSISVCLVTVTSAVQAQSIQIDGTTPTTPDTCSGNCTIGGGLLQRGDNLFHSFSQFNVDSGATVLFLDPGVRNILTRVTGNAPSNIRGTLGISGGNANLFLINPNGIIFGENAKLDVKGSFVATTADAIQFGNQGFFRASASEVPLLTVNPSALFHQSANSPIENRASVNGLSVPDGRSLLLVGGEVNLNGGKLNAFGGRVELGGLAEAGVIGLDVDNNNLRLSFPENTALADVFFSNEAIANVTADGGGSITLNARNIGISGKSSLLNGIEQKIVGRQAGGDITLNATGTVTVTDQSRIVNRVRTGAQGNSGNINIKAGSLSLSKAGLVEATTFGIGNAGNVNIDVGNGTVAVVGINSNLNSTVGEGGRGNSGDIKITARELSLRDGGSVNSGTYGAGNAGNIFVEVSDIVSIESESVINTGIFSNVAVGAVGNAGEINIQTTSLSLSGAVQIGASVFGKTQENPGVIGSRGNILVNADSVTISGASLDTGYSSGLFTLTDEGAEGAAGNITVNTRDFRITDGATVNAQTRNSGSGGNITINTTTFEAINGGQVITTASSSGKAGNITVNATDSITLSGSDPTFAERKNNFQDIVQNEGATSGLFASTRTNSTGSGGDIAIATQKLTVQNEAQISVSSKGEGDAGNIDINAHNISLDNEGKLTSETASGQGGDITLEARDLLLMRRKSQISTDAASDGDGGNITINVPNGFIVGSLFGNSDITANANFGFGGEIKITTKNIFGFVRRTGADIAKLDPTGENKPSNLQTNDITAFSRQNPSLDGTVQINSPDADPSKGLVELPVNLVDTSQQIVADCNSGGKAGRSSFITTGRGGLVDDPTQPLIADDAVLVDWIALSPESKNRADGIQKRALVHNQQNTEGKLQKVNSVNEPTQIVEAQGWVIDANGNVVLVAQVPTATPHNFLLTSKSCPAN